MTTEAYGVMRDIVFFVILPVMVFLWGRDRKQVSDAIQAQFGTLRGEMLSALALRDQRINTIDQRMDRAAEHSSREGGRIMEKMENFRERLVRVESELGGRRAHDTP